ncbi:MAG: hypothetical protein JNJ57_16305 [Saprospiraceae bacterium]|nr:hypothetical protein [Saprospiraceae bacterium]
MKQKNNGLMTSKWVILTLLSVGLTGLAQAQTEKKRTVEKVFDGKTALWASHRYGDLVLHRNSGTQTKAVLTLSAKGKDEKETQEFLDAFELYATEAPDNKLDVQTSNQIDCWNTINGRSTIKFTNGKQFSGIKDFNMQLDIYVPRLRYATLENKYAAIRTEDGTTAILEAILFDGKLDLQGSFEQLKLDVKYSDGTVGNFNTGKSVLYDSDVAFGSGKNMEISSKYSGIKMGSAETLTLECFDDNYKIGAVSGQLTINDKYSEFRFSGNWGTANCQFYDSEVEALNADRVTITSSKYSEFEFQELNSLHFDESFDDAVKIAKVGALSAANTKYTEYNIGGLWKSLTFNESFDDDINVQTVGATFEGMVFHGKYTDVTLPIPASVKYEVNAEMKYGKLVYPDSELESSYYKEKGETVSIKGKLKGAGVNAPKIEITSFDGDIRLK